MCMPRYLICGTEERGRERESMSMEYILVYSRLFSLRLYE